MDFKIISDVENSLFNRREIEGEIHAEVTPSKEEVAKLISEKIKVSEDAIKIKTIMGKFGSRVFLIVANIYSSKKEKDDIEQMTKQEKEAEEKLKKQAEEEAKAAMEAKKTAAEDTKQNLSEADAPESEPIPEQQEKTDEVIKETKKEENSEEKKE